MAQQYFFFNFFTVEIQLSWVAENGAVGSMVHKVFFVSGGLVLLRDVAALFIPRQKVQGPAVLI